MLKNLVKIENFYRLKFPMSLFKMNEWRLSTYKTKPIN